MRSNSFKPFLIKSGLAACAFLLAGGTAFGQQQINLTAAPASTTLPDGSTVPMWGYGCGAAVTGSSATCKALNATATGKAWSPVVITVPTGQDLQINLTNNLSFGTTNLPTSLTIVGQLGGGLGTVTTSCNAASTATSGSTCTPSPAHAQLGVSWATPNTPGGTNPTFTPPPQGARVQSFATEVAATPATTAQTPTPLLWKAPRPGTYLIESGTHPSIQGSMGLYGILVVTAAPTATVAGIAYPSVNYDADVPMLLSEIDPVQNIAVSIAVNKAGFSESTVWSGQPGGCGNPASTSYQTCYPPVVNYSPLYYLFNGVAFNKTSAAASLFPASATIPATPLTGTGTGSVLVRFVNAGLRMHVPSIVGSLTGRTPVTSGFSLIAEDGNPLPGVARVQSEVFMAAGKTYDVMINAPAACTPVPPATCTNSALPVFDRQLSLSGNAIDRDAGMLAYIGINGATLPTAATGTSASVVARPDTYNSPPLAGQTLTVSDPSLGLMANDTNVYGVQLLTAPANGTLTLNANGTFTYVPTGTGTADSFTYCANGSVTAAIPPATAASCSSGKTATVTLAACTTTSGCLERASGIHVMANTFTANTATYLAVKTPGMLAGATDAAGYPLTVATTSVTPTAGLTVVPDANGGFTATAAAAGTYTFTYQAQNSQGTQSVPGTVTLIFPQPSGLAVTVLDGSDKQTAITDYRWIIEEDRTFYIDPTTVTNNGGTSIVPTLGVNFHTSYMPFVAQGCTGPQSCEGGQSVLGKPSVCDVGNGACRPDTTGQGFTPVLPSQVHLDPTKRYYISVLPGDAANPFYNASPNGHGMGGAPIGIDPNTKVQQSAVTVLTQPSPYPTAQLSVFVFEDDFPLNGEHDGGGGIDVVAPNEPGLGGFQIHLWDAMGGNGDFTGQMSYDMFNQPLSNSLAGTIDPNTHLNACPISKSERSGKIKDPKTGLLVPDPTQTGITGMIVTCPKYESDGKTLSPLAGQAVIANLMPGRFGVIATPAADRIARGEEWLQTNTLDGQKAHDSFARIGEPSYFQEFGPASYHVSIGFANPKIINDRKASVCNGTSLNVTGPNCTNTIKGTVTGQRLSRTPDERLYSSGTHDTFYWSQCYVSVGDPDGIDFAFTKCNADGTFTLTGLPDGDWRITTFDQWNDQLVDGLSTPVRLAGGKTVNMEIAATQWQTNLYTRTFIDDNKDGISQSAEAGIPFANVAVRLRDGSLENLLVTDFTGTANFNETFPLFSWYTVETDVTRYKNTGTHVVYDAGGPADGSFSCGQTGYPPCGTSAIGRNLANTVEQISVPANLRVPGSVYCADADCSGKSIQSGPAGSAPPSVCHTDSTGATTCSTTLSTGRIDSPWLGGVEGWQGFPGQNSFLEFGKEPYVPGENGGIKGHVVYASTRPFDDPQMLVQTQWEPLVPHVTINLYQEGFNGVTPTLTLVDTTQTTSFDDWAQGFRPDGTPNMNCPGQGAATGPNPDLFFFSLDNQPDYLDLYNHQHNGTPLHSLPNNSQFKCYDGMHNWNQLQPAPYDGMYQFPSVTSLDPATGKPNGTNCKICSANTAVPTTDLYYKQPMLPTGKYVIEVVVPPGFELVKEEDKNILIGDNFIAPVTQQFGNLGNIFIVPDQASVASAYNANNAQNSTNSFGTSPQNGIVPSNVPEPSWPCVGESRIVPDYISLFPQSKQMAPFAGATRNLCDRKEVTLADQMGAIAKFYVYTSTHVASKFTGGITDDYTSEFDPFSPQFGEKFAPPDLPVSVKDWTGAETNRVYADHWGAYNGMTYSTWEVNPPNPTGYSPTMMVFCMNDPGPILDTKAGSPTNGQLITDPLFTQGYSQFCYELPFMPGTTQYLDTPVVPTSAFAGAGYNNVDCAYPDATPAISEVDGDGAGPWVSAAGNTLTVTALGDQMVPNYAYSGPSATTAPFNQKTIKRHYGFGNAKGTVSVGGVAVPAASVTWADGTISFPVPGGVPACNIQQQTLYGGSTALCGELVITAANGKQSIDTVTVTIGGKAPTHVLASGTIQGAIDAAAPGDLIIVDPTCNTAAAAGVACTTTGVTTKSTAAHNEVLLMWKPVRLQGVGAASSIVNANTHPAGKLDPWRREVDCLFGLAMNGQPFTGNGPASSTNANSFDPTGTYSCGANANFSGTPTTLAYFSPSANNPQVDRQPLEATLGWDANLSGNLAELLQEPALMGALEGAGITVLSKGVYFPSNPYDPTLFAGFPTGTVLFTAGNTSRYCDGTYPSNFQCNPSSIDGLGITNSSQGGGGIFVHAWGHNLQIANNRIYNNSGTLSGGINLGQGEFPPSYTQGGTNAAPGSCESGGAAGSQLAYCHDSNVNMHHNYVSLNSSTGDELFSATPAGAGGVSICTGSDYYKFNYNWVCGNLSNGDGGGVGHLGFSKNGDIEHNSILFNQSTNPTIPTNGGGLVIMGTPDVDPACGAATDADCVPALGTVGPSDGIGPGLVINANLIMGNAAESGSGGGIAFQHVNGSDVVSFPTQPGQWYGVQFTNNIVANNVAGWDGGGISLLDAFKVDIINNTVMGNVTTASSGALTNTLGAPLASTQNCPPGGVDPATGLCTVMITSSTPQPAGLVSINDTATLLANLPASITCPAQYNAPGAGTTNGTCRSVSYPRLHNNVFWQNSPYYIAAGALSPQFQQKVVSLYNAFSNTLVASQPTADATTANGTGVIITGGTGACLAGNNTGYWDIGVRGDTGPNNHGSGIRLNPRWSVLTPGAAGYATNNLTNNPEVQSQYCNGSRQPPEACTATNGCGWAVPPGIADATVPNPIFSLTPVATVDEGNNWINLRWGPLSLVNPVNGTVLGNYALASTSAAIDYVPVPDADAAGFPTTDFFGNPRPDPSNPNAFDVGAVEFQGAATQVQPVLTSIAPASAVRGASATNVNVTLSGTGLTATRNATAAGITVTNVVVASDTAVTATFRVAPGTALGAHKVHVGTASQTSNDMTFMVAAPPSRVSIAPNPRRITLPTNVFAGIGTVTLRNTGGSPVTVSNVAVAGGSMLNGFIAAGDGCTGTTLAPNQTCTVGVAYLNFIGPRGAGNDVNGTITFTDTGAASPQVGALIGHSNP
jgi:hypothetical protein